MSLPLEKLLDSRGNKYENCVAAMKIAQRLAAEWGDEAVDEEDLEDRPEKISIIAMNRLLSGEITIKPQETDEEIEDAI
jgi:DNA-directed RNA polymerase subunit K/omega